MPARQHHRAIGPHPVRQPMGEIAFGQPHDLALGKRGGRPGIHGGQEQGQTGRQGGHDESRP